NGQSTALVDPAGSICWMPHPMPHSSSMFSEILGTEAAGFFAVGPASGAAPLTQRYLGNSTLLETRWAGLNCIDYLAPVDGYSDDTIVIRVLTGEIGRASCRERVEVWGGGGRTQPATGRGDGRRDE